MNDADLAVSLVTLGDPDRLTGGYLYHVRMAEMAAAHGARVRFASFPERAFPLPAAGAPRVVASVRAQHPDVVLLDSIAAWALAPSLAFRPLPAPLAAVLHQPPGGIDHAWPRAALQARLDRLAYRFAVRVLVASEALAEQVVAAGVRADRLRVVPPGRDVAETAPDAPPPLRRRERCALLCVGNWVPRKGILELLDAVAALPPGAAVLHLVGDDRADPPYRRRVRERLERPDLAGRVEVHGPVSREQVAAFYRAADVFVLPSVREPYGTVYGEAMAAGLPVVGWRAGNLPHLADHGEEGLILPVGDVAGLAAALERLAADEGERRRLGEAARRRAGALPTWHDSAAAFFGALREVGDGGVRRS